MPIDGLVLHGLIQTEWWQNTHLAWLKLRNSNFQSSKTVSFHRGLLWWRHMCVMISHVRYGISNHRKIDRFPNSVLGLATQIISMFHIAGSLREESMTGRWIPFQMEIMRKFFLCHDTMRYVENLTLFSRSVLKLYLKCVSFTFFTVNVYLSCAYFVCEQTT